MTCAELLVKSVLLIFESTEPETWLASSHTSQDLFSPSYPYFFLNILGIKLILEENSAVSRGKWPCAGPWPLTLSGQFHER